VSFEPNEKDPRCIIWANDNGKLIFKCGNWQTMTLVTGKGKKLLVVDLLFYNSSIKEGKPGYWASPKNWKKNAINVKTIEHKGKERTVLLEGKYAGVTKQVYVSISPDKPLVYVVNRLIATDKIVIKHDFQLTWISANVGDPMYASEIMLDGELQPQKSGTASKYAYFYRPKVDACYAIFLMPKNLQRLKLRNILTYNWHAGKGAELLMRKAENTVMLPGEILEQRYIIYWNDGKDITEAGFLSEDIEAGKLNTFFYPQ